MTKTTYFVLRNGNIAGPLTTEKLHSLFKEKRINRIDKISTSQNGPWHAAEEVARTFAKKQSNTISRFEFGKTLTGRHFARFNCNECKISLKTFLDEYQECDVCPECGSQFRLSSSAFNAMQQEDEANKRSLQQAKDEKRLAKDEKRQKREAERQAKAREQEKRNQVKQQLVAKAKSEHQLLVNKALSQPRLGDGVLRLQRAGVFGALTAVKVAIDGVVLTKLKANQMVDLTLTPGQHLLEISGGGAFSGKRADLNIEPNAIQQFNIGYTPMGGLQLGMVGAAALTANAVTSDGTLDAAIEVIATAAEVTEIVADVADVASGLFDLFGDD